MTPTSLRTHVLTRSKTILFKGLQAALVASPVLLSAAPSHAVTRVFTGFTEAFAPANWSLVGAGGYAGTATIDSSSLTLIRPTEPNQPNQISPIATYAISSALLESFPKPAYAGAFKSGTYSFDWTWSTTSTVANSADRYVFAPTVDGIAGAKFNPALAAANTPFSGSVSNYATVVDGQTIGFFHTKTSGGGNGDSTGVISNFVFEATYQYVDVPGPLPLAGAAAGFAWSRRLRNRLRNAQTNA
jgi:hypothetical protein